MFTYFFFHFSELIVVCNNFSCYYSFPGLPLRDMEELRGGSEDVEVKYDAESARIEAWLDEHPDFANDYFIRFVL